MAVRKITYGHKRPDLLAATANAEDQPEDEPKALQPSYFSEEEPSDFPQPVDQLSEFPAQANQPPAFPMDSQPTGVPAQFSQPHAVPLPPRQPVNFPMPTDQMPGFPMPANQNPGVPAPSAPGFPAPSSQAPVFRASSSRLPAFPAPSEAEVVPAAFYEVPDSETPEDQIPAAPIAIDPKKDPRKVGRSTLIEPKKNLQDESEPKRNDDQPPPLEYFK